jgi:hypothetical protein
MSKLANYTKLKPDDRVAKTNKYLDLLLDPSKEKEDQKKKEDSKKKKIKRKKEIQRKMKIKRKKKNN